MKTSLLAGSLGIIFMAFGAILLVPILVAVPEGEYSSVPPFLYSSSCGIIVGLLLHRLGSSNRNYDAIRRNEGLLIVALAWVGCGILGALPYLFFKLSFLDALFESVSGITTTGATILTDFSLYPKVFYFWRSFSQWLGGMGIIVLFIAILPQFGVAGRKIFFAEAPGPTEEKITPRIAHTAKALWLVYLILTVLLIVALILAGMEPFDALCNSFSTLAAGGFSPNPQSIMGYNSPTITWIISLFMLLAGANFALQFQCFLRRQPKALIGSEEFRFYCWTVLGWSGLLVLFLWASGYGGVEICIRDSLFQILSIITTTGFSSADFALWVVAAQTVLFAMMLVGGCAGSAGGGIKVVRVMFILKYLKREIEQIVHPNAVLPIKIDRTTVQNDIQRQMLSFVFFYLILMIFSGLAVTMIEHDGGIGFVGTAATLGNVGPGFGEIGPMGSFGGLHPLTKCIFILDMLVGRLELIPFLVMLSPEFWRMSRG